MRFAQKALAFLMVLLLLAGMSAAATAEQNQSSGGEILKRDAEWKFMVTNAALDAAWTTEGFDDSAWETGKAPLGFGDDYSETDPSLPIGTVVGFGGDDANKNITTYFRSVVDAGKISGYSELEVYIHVDDGAVVYINGQEVFRKGIEEGTEVKYDTTAKFKPKEETFRIPASLLKDGINVIAAEVHQDGGDSSDLWFEMGITGIKTDLIILTRDAQWKYDDGGNDLGSVFAAIDYDDSAWQTGKAPLGFGDDYSETDPSLPIGTVVGFGGDDANKNMTTYFRTVVEVGDLTGYAALECYIHVDDGAVVYVNGKEVLRKGIDEGIEVKYDTTSKFKPKEEILNLPMDIFQTGSNVIAVQVHQDGGDSSDLWFEMGMTALAQLRQPEAAAVVIPDPNAPLGSVSKVTVTFTGNTASTKGFTWYTTLASAGSDLQIVKKTADTADFSNAACFSGAYTLSTNSPMELVHKAEAAGLLPGTEYFYRVGDAALNLWSEPGVFATVKADGAFTFVNLADSQAKAEDEAILSAQTFEKAMNVISDAAFLSINGDIVDTGMNESQWDWLLGHSQKTLMNTTIVPVAGNHDEDKNSFYEHFNLTPAPGSATETGVYYSFNVSNTHFVGLNTNEDSPEYADFTPAQVQWMKDNIQNAKALGYEWVIVFIHKGPYTTSNHAEDTDIMDPVKGVRTMIAPLFSELKVDLVLEGHDHIYARSKPIQNGKAIDPEKIIETLNGQTIEYSVKPDGTIYLIPATAGPKVYYKSTKMPKEYFDLFESADENHAAVYGPDPADDSRPVRSAIQNFVGITIDGSKLTAVTYEIDQNKDPSVPYIVDQFGIVK